MTWRSSEDDENGVPSPAHPLSVAEGEGEGDRGAGIFERERTECTAQPSKVLSHSTASCCARWSPRPCEAISHADGTISACGIQPWRPA